MEADDEHLAMDMVEADTVVMSDGVVLLGCAQRGRCTQRVVVD